MDSMAEHEPYETPHGSLRTAAKPAAKRGIPRRNHWQRRPRECRVGVDCPEYCDSDHCRCCSPLLRVSLFDQTVSIRTTLAWTFLMFSYLHDQMHVKNFWMEHNSDLKAWFRGARK